MKLTNNQFRFVEFICQDMTQGEAYKKAYNRDSVGEYEKKHGYRLAANPKIKEAVQARRDAFMKKVGITAEAILEKMWDMACSVFAADAAKIQALVWLGKYKGLWGDRVGDGGGSVINLQINNFGSMTQEEIDLLNRIPGERHFALQLQAATVPTPVLDSNGARGEKDSQGEPSQGG